MNLLVIIALCIVTVVLIICGLYFSTEKAREAFVCWTCFTVIFGAMPILVTLLDVWRNHKHLSISVLSNGELILLASVISADALGKAIFCKAQKRILIGITGSLCGVLVGLATYIFVSISKTVTKDPEVLSRNGELSVIVFVATIMLSGACLITSESSKEVAGAPSSTSA